MRSRLFNFLSCLLLSATAVQTAQAVDLTTQRQYYDEAKRALAKGDTGPYMQYSQALADYPLTPYLAYDELTARLKSASNQEIEQFLAKNGDLPQANWMKLRWLRWLAERGDWQTFEKYYDPKLNFVELDCLHGQYQLTHNLKAEGYKTAEKLWMTGKSQPAACDTTFGQWAAAGQLTEQKIWDRAKLAAEARNYALANSLVKTLPTLGAQGRLMVDVAQKPDMLSDPSRFLPATEAMSDAVGLGLRRLARQDPDKAMALLDGYASSMHFSRDEKVSIAREIGRQPVLAFGNSKGDASMLNYTITNNPYRSAAFILLCDDLDRELGSLKKAQATKALAEKNGWLSVSMRDEFKTIYGDEVKRQQ